MFGPRFITAAIAASLFAGCSTGREKMFSLVGYQTYRREVHPIAADTGRELVNRFCFAPPPGCEANSIACSIHPEFPSADWRYRFDVVRAPILKRARRRGKAIYYVRGVHLDPAAGHAYTFEPERPGRVVMWQSISADLRQRELVGDYLKRESGPQMAKIRLDYLDRMVDEIQWHERQHVREGIAFNRELERIMNTPSGYPKRLVLHIGQRPDRVLEEAVERDRERRIQRLLRRNDACAREFHRHENRAGSYSTILTQCACFGGWACTVKLPPEPKADFRCDVKTHPARRGVRVLKRPASRAFRAARR